MAAEPPARRKVPALTLTLPVKALAALTISVPLPDLVSEPAAPEMSEATVSAFAAFEPATWMMTSEAAAPRELPVMVAAPVELSNSTPPEVTVRTPPSESVWAPASFKELTDSAPATMRSAVER